MRRKYLNNNVSSAVSVVKLFGGLLESFDGGMTWSASARVTALKGSMLCRTFCSAVSMAKLVCGLLETIGGRFNLSASVKVTAFDGSLLASQSSCCSRRTKSGEPFCISMRIVCDSAGNS